MVDYKRTDKTGFIARLNAPINGTYYHDGTAQGVANASPHHYLQKVDIGASAGTCVGWQNPHAGQVIVSGVMVNWVTAGTGTMDVGTGTTGTGASNIFIDGGTMTGLVVAGGSGTAGDGRAGAILAGSGTVADSVTVTMNEAGTSTAVGTLYFNVTVL